MDVRSGRAYSVPCNVWIRGGEAVQLVVPGHENAASSTQYHCLLWLEVGRLLGLPSHRFHRIVGNRLKGVWPRSSARHIQIVVHRRYGNRNKGD